MKKSIVLLLFALVAVIVFYNQFDYKEFMREMGLRKKCGEDYIGINSKFLERNFHVERKVNGVVIRNIPENMKDDILKNSHGDVVWYLKSNDFRCVKENNNYINCTLRRDVELVPAPDCKKGTKVMYSKGKFIVEVFVKSSDNFDLKYGFTTSE